MSQKILGTGFLLSFITQLLILINPFLAFIAIFTYIGSIILRTIGWNKMGQITNEGYYSKIGIAVLILGILFISLVLGSQIVEQIFGPNDYLYVFIAILMWVIYSLLEWVAYLKLFRAGKRIFAGSAISVIGILVIIAIAINLTTSNVAEAIFLILFFRAGILFLAISSLISAIGFYTLKEEYELDSIEYR